MGDEIIHSCHLLLSKIDSHQNEKIPDDGENENYGENRLLNFREKLVSRRCGCKRSVHQREIWS